MMINRIFPYFDVAKTLDEMDRVLGSVGRPEGFRSVPRGTFPAINIYDHADHIVLTAEVPGVGKDHLDLSVQGKALTLKGERPAPDNGDTAYCRRERMTGPFERTVTLPGWVNPDSAEAEYRDGVLIVKLDKAEREKVKQISIKS